jgi:hypothetical protein
MFYAMIPFLGIVKLSKSSSWSIKLLNNALDFYLSNFMKSCDLYIALGTVYKNSFIAAIFAVVTSYFLSLFFGLTGASIGSLLLDLALFLYVLPRSCKLIGQPLNSLWRELKIDSKTLLSYVLNKSLI